MLIEHRMYYHGPSGGPWLDEDKIPEPALCGFGSAKHVKWAPVSDIDHSDFIAGVLSTSGVAFPGIDKPILDPYVNSKFIQIEKIAANSQCERAKIGCIVKPIGSHSEYTGYNYLNSECATGSCHDLKCQPEVTCRLTTHAEVMALDGVPRGDDVDGHILFCSAVPCLDCMKACILRNVKYVIFLEARQQPEYDVPAMQFLARNGGIKFFRYMK